MKRKNVLVIILVVLLLISMVLNIIEVLKFNRESSEERDTSDYLTKTSHYRYKEIVDLTVNGKYNEESYDDNLISIVSIRERDIKNLISSAYELIGESYIYGDVGVKGYDCSGLIYSLYLNQLGIELPRNSSAQSKVGIKVDKTQLIPGDLLFFNTAGRGISHVGIYIGKGKMIHASSENSIVRIDNIDENYYRKRYVTARRILYWLIIITNVLNY